LTLTEERERGIAERIEATGARVEYSRLYRRKIKLDGEACRRATSYGITQALNS
jgi:uroporphyrinogen-III synthase